MISREPNQRFSARKMDLPKSRPTVTITTYSANNSSYLRQHKSQSQMASGGRLQQSQKGDEPEEFATKCEFSTNLFRNNLRQLNNSSGEGNSGDRRSHETSSNNSGKGLRLGGPRSALSELSQIRGPTGSVRGHKDVVRKSLEGIKVTYHNRFKNFSYSSLSAINTPSSSGGSSLMSFSTFFASQSARHQQGGNSNQPSLTSFSSNKSKLSMTTGNSLLTIDNELFCSEYLERLVEDEQDLCVAYTTTLGVIRRTFEDSKRLRSILDLNLVSYQERDIYLNQEYKYQLKLRLGSIVVPALFVDGVHIGGAKELETMNENGELTKLFAKFKMLKAPKGVCHCCGNAKFIACQSCNGSRKSTIHHFKFNSIALRCIKCDKNDGLVQCPVCCVGRPEVTCDQTLANGPAPAEAVKICASENCSSQEVVQTDVATMKILSGVGVDGKDNNNEEGPVDLNNNSVEC